MEKGGGQVRVINRGGVNDKGVSTTRWGRYDQEQKNAHQLKKKVYKI